MKSGAHVICQKPFTQNIEQTRSVTELTKTTDRLVVVHENFRFQPWYRKIKSLIQNGLVGQIYQVQFRLRPGDGQGADAYLARQPYFQKMPRFLIQETGIHFIDVFRYLLGEPHSLFADLYRLNPAIKGEDAGIFSLEFDHRLRAIFDGNRLADHPANNRRLTLGEMHMEGEIGSLLLNGDGELLFRRHGENESSQIEFEFHDNAFGGDCVYELQKHVLTCLKTGTTPENLVSDYLKNLIIQEYIYQSSSQGKRLELPRFT
ncbi:MAG: gfo/Idh/MocA family oxidoreductase [Gammaproteobacteria bacterium]|nr:gfo/Idh/MocA family oxidoreductase [Gammaproteobacteria bacterium]